MSVLELIRRARDEGVFLFTEEGKLKFRAKAKPSDALRSEILAQKPELIQFLTQHTESKAPSGPTPSHSAGPQPLSKAQARIFFQEQAYATGAAYRMAQAWRFDAPVDPDQLRGALEQIATNHAVLRSQFLTGEQGTPVQHPLSHETFSPCLSVERDRPAVAWLEEQNSLEFDLAAGRVFRSGLLLNRDETFLYLAFHHIVFDGWSYGPFLSDLMRLFGGEPPKKPAYQYGDFAAWEAETPTTGTTLGFWKETLEGVAPLNGFPTDIPRAPKASFDGALVKRRLCATTLRDLRQLAMDSSVSLNAALLAVFGVVQARYRQDPDCVIGAPVAGRTAPASEALIGLFANVVPLRLNASGTTSFRALLTQSGEALRAALSHQDLALEQIVQALGFAGEASYTPLIQSVFTCSEERDQPLILAGNRGTKVELPRHHVAFETELHLNADGEGGFEALWAYRSDLFQEATIQALAGVFEDAIAQLSAAPDKPLNEINLVPAVVQELWQQSNRVSAPYPLELGLADLLEQQAGLRPDELACTWREETGALQNCSYGDLNGRANALAHALLHAGLKPGDCVGVITAERGPETIIAMLAVLKCGAAYVILDPGAPAERLQRILKRCNCHTVIGDEAELPQGYDGRTLPRSGWGQSQENPDRRALGWTPDHPALLVFTSGSTGTPKGVEIPSSALTNLLHASHERLGFDNSSCFAVTSSLTFDAHLFEVHLALAFGGRLALIEADRFRRADTLTADQEALAPTHIFATPSTWQLLLQEGWHPAGGTTLLTGGEGISARLKDQLLQAAPDLRLINLYGPSEGTTYSLACDLSLDQPVTAGLPLPNTAARVMDPSGQECPPLCTGELIISGAQIAAGYCQQPELSAQQFKPCKHAPAGTRQYATGDLARRWPDGRIEILGRMDDQIKRNGVRIELAEIEAALATHPEVRQVAVLAQAQDAADMSLVAYVATSMDRPSATRTLAAYLADQLPTAFLPNSYMVLDQLPQTASGKIDRKRLPAAQLTPVALGKAPENAREQRICEIWSELLNLTVDCTQTSFFTYGGHSLLSVQMLNRVNQEFDRSISLKDVIRDLTVSHLARLLSEDQAAPFATIPSPSGDGPFPLSTAQQRLWAIDQISAQGRFYTIPLCLDIQGDLAPERIEDFLLGFMRRHAALRTAIQQIDGAPQQVIKPLPDRILQVVEAGSAPDDVQQEILQETEQSCFDAPFDLESGLLLRSALVRLSATRQRWFLAMHHIAFDGQSMAIFWQELAQVLTSPDTKPKPPACSYAGYALWQRAQPQNPRALAHWCDRLATAPRLHCLPLDKARPTVPSYRGATLVRSLGQDQRRQMTDLARGCEATEFTLIHSALCAFLSHKSGANGIVTGTPVTNRDHPALEDVVGFFVNTLALYRETDPSQSLIELLPEAQQRMQTDLSHHSTPFDQVVDALKLDRSLSHTPLFQIMVQADNSALQGLEFDALSLTEVQPIETEAKFDLTLGLRFDNGFHISWNYATDLFAPETIAGWAEEFNAFLNAVLEAPERPLAALLPHSPSAARICGPQKPESNLRFIEHVQREVENAPTQIAAIWQGQEISYQDLFARAHRLAEGLRSQGIGPGDLVGLHLPRSPELLTGLLAVHLVGAAHLPLDPGYPAGRLHAIADQARPALILSCQPLERFKAPVLDPENHRFCPAAPSYVALRGNPDRAYVIFTSGSTGRPKGVEIPHRAFSNFLDWFREDLELSFRDRVLAVSAPGFDIAATELMAPLTLGATVVLSAPGEEQDPDRLADLVEQHQPSLLQMVPSTLSLLLEGLGHRRPGSVRRLLCGGEAVATQLLQRAAQQLPQARICTVYGPTEATIWASLWTYDGSTHNGTALIGTPLRNMEFSLLDAQGQAVGIGQSGVLHIAGPGLALGYFRDEGSTRQAFLEPAQTGGHSRRLYRTGDLAQLTSGGDCAFLGREDSQIKLRGYRIELGEIEAALLQAGAGLAQCQLRHDQIIAFVSSEDPNTLRRAIASQLPAYMIPGQIVPLPQFPRLPNGKINRQALAVLPLPEMSPAAGFLPPDGEAEETLADIWSQVLGRSPIGRHDDFFALGGHSLLAIRVAEILRAMLECDVPVRTLFEHTTLSALARHLSETYLQAPSRTDA